MFSSNFNFCTLVFESWNTKFGRVVVHYTINRTNKDCRRYELPTVVVGTCKSKIEQTHVFLVHFVSCILLFLRCFVNFDPEWRTTKYKKNRPPRSLLAFFYYDEIYVSCEFDWLNTIYQVLDTQLCKLRITSRLYVPHFHRVSPIVWLYLVVDKDQPCRIFYLNSKQLPGRAQKNQFPWKRMIM